jgi:hypothetical protein
MGNCCGYGEKRYDYSLVPPSIIETLSPKTHILAVKPPRSSPLLPYPTSADRKISRSSLWTTFPSFSAYDGLKSSPASAGYTRVPGQIHASATHDPEDEEEDEHDLVMVLDMDDDDDETLPCSKQDQPPHKPKSHSMLVDVGSATSTIDTDQLTQELLQTRQSKRKPPKEWEQAQLMTPEQIQSLAQTRSHDANHGAEVSVMRDIDRDLFLYEPLR